MALVLKEKARGLSLLGINASRGDYDAWGETKNTRTGMKAELELGKA